MGESTQDGEPARGLAPEGGACSRTLRLVLQYEGSDFAGWQVQPGLRTVQGELESALRRILDEPGLHVIASGRTDSGTHAAAQVAHFRARSRLPVEAMKRGLNSVLGRDLRVVELGEAPPEFHARYSAIAKEYRYHFWHGSPAPPFLRRFVYNVSSRLDVDAMHRAAGLVVGTQDLSSFRSAHCRASTPLRTVYSAVVGGRGDVAVFAILGKGFLQHMVRILAGTLLRVGRGQLELEAVRALVAARDRRLAPPTAPAHGLWLTRVLYEGNPELLAAAPEPMLTFGKSDS